MGENINIYGVGNGGIRTAVPDDKPQFPAGPELGRIAVSQTSSQPNDRQQRREWFKNQAKRQKDIEKMLGPIVGTISKIHTDEGDFDVVIDSKEVRHLAYDASQFMNVEEAQSLLNVGEYLRKASYVESMWDKEYNPVTDTFHSTKRKGRRHFERFYYLKYPIGGNIVLFQVGRTSDRIYNGGKNDGSRRLDENGNPTYHYFLHAIKRKRE